MTAATLASVLFLLSTAGSPARASERRLPSPADLPAHFLGEPFAAAAKDFRERRWPDAVNGFARALRVKRRPLETLRAKMLYGLALGSSGRYADCAEQFEGLWKTDGLLRPYYAYQAGRCNLQAAQLDRAATWAVKVPADSVFSAESRVIALQALERERKWEEILRRSSDFESLHPRGPGLHEVRTMRAVALEARGRAAEAAAIWRKVWAGSSEGLFRRAEKSLERLGQDASPAVRAAAVKTAQDWLARGMLFFDRHDNEDAERTLASALTAPALDPGTTCRAKYHLAQSLWKMKQRKRALPLFQEAERACRIAGEADLTVQSIYQAARCLPFTGDRPGAMAQYSRIESEFPRHSYADDARLRAAEEAAVLGADDQAEQLLATLPDRYPGGDMVGEAIWRRAFKRMLENDPPGALLLLQENLAKVPRADIWYAEGRAEYWIGRLQETSSGPASRAADWYERAIRKYPLSVYAWQSLLRLDQIAPAAARALIRQLRSGRAGKGRAKAVLRNLEHPGLLRAVAFGRSGLASEANRELARVRRIEGESTVETDATSELQWLSALVLHHAGLWSLSHTLISDQPAFRLSYPVVSDLGPWQLAYPTAYAELVREASRRHLYPAPLQFAIMREESAFNPRAVSPAGCLGLTMVKPSTGEYHLRRPVGRAELFEPTTNVALGGRELQRLLKTYKGSTWLAVAAYNAGQAAVDRWRARFGDASMDEFLERIPFDETRGYTKRVLASYFVYTWLYDKGQSIPRDRLPVIPVR